MVAKRGSDALGSPGIARYHASGGLRYGTQTMLRAISHREKENVAGERNERTDTTSVVADARFRARDDPSKAVRVPAAQLGNGRPRGADAISFRERKKRRGEQRYPLTE